MEVYDEKNGVVEIYNANAIDNAGFKDEFFEYYLNANEQTIYGWRVYSVYHVGGKNKAVIWDSRLEELFAEYRDDTWIVH